MYLIPTGQHADTKTMHDTPLPIIAAFIFSSLTRKYLNSRLPTTIVFGALEEPCADKLLNHGCRLTAIATSFLAFLKAKLTVT